MAQLLPVVSRAIQRVKRGPFKHENTPGRGVESTYLEGTFSTQYPTRSPCGVYVPLQFICLHQLADRTNLLGTSEDATASSHLPRASLGYSSFCVSSPPPPWQSPPPLPLEQGLPLEAAAVVSTGP